MKDDGQLVLDVALLMVADDENDQGYYDDVAISQDEVDITFERITILFSNEVLFISYSI